MSYLSGSIVLFVYKLCQTSAQKLFRPDNYYRSITASNTCTSMTQIRYLLRKIVLKFFKGAPIEKVFIEIFVLLRTVQRGDCFPIYDRYLI